MCARSQLEVNWSILTLFVRPMFRKAGYIELYSLVSLGESEGLPRLFRTIIVCEREKYLLKYRERERQRERARVFAAPSFSSYIYFPPYLKFILAPNGFFSHIYHHIIGHTSVCCFLICLFLCVFVFSLSSFFFVRCLFWRLFV